MFFNTNFQNTFYQNQNNKTTKQSSSMDTEPDEYNDSYNQNEIRIHQSKNDDLSKISKNGIFCKIHISIL